MRIRGLFLFMVLILMSFAAWGADEAPTCRFYCTWPGQTGSCVMTGPVAATTEEFMSAARCQEWCSTKNNQRVNVEVVNPELCEEWLGSTSTDCGCSYNCQTGECSFGTTIVFGETTFDQPAASRARCERYCQKDPSLASFRQFVCQGGITLKAKNPEYCEATSPVTPQTPINGQPPYPQNDGTCLGITIMDQMINTCGGAVDNNRVMTMEQLVAISGPPVRSSSPAG